MVGLLSKALNNLVTKNSFSFSLVMSIAEPIIVFSAPLENCQENHLTSPFLQSILRLYLKLFILLVLPLKTLTKRS
jgi:hypothetical protein